ncbi:MAG: TonB-dependent siderophore receptor [Chitinophagaceae bacterium]
MMKSLITLTTVFLPIFLSAQDSTRTKELNKVTIVGFRNIYKVDSSATVAKIPLRDLENPQVYNTISKNILKDQVITNMNNALKNATGITRLWESTGRGGDGAEYYTMRGFSIQPTLMNAMPNITNGTIDPINIEQIEVIKGPSGTLFGGNIISYGGLINIVTKKPYESFGGELGFVSGSYGLNRFTADINTPLGNGVFARVNAAYQDENSFQDAGFNRSFYIAPSLKMVASNKLTFHVNAEFRNAESANAPMWFLSRYQPLAFNNIDIFAANYKNSYTENGLSIKNPGFSYQAQAVYTISKHWTSQTILSNSNTRTDGYYHYLYDVYADGDRLDRYISKRNGQALATDIQQNFIGDIMTGSMRHRVLIGLDYLTTTIRNNSTGWVANGFVSMGAQTDSGILTPQGVDKLLEASSEGNSVAQTNVMSAYVSDVINFTPALSAMLSARIEHFKGLPLYASAEIKSQTSVSPKLGLVYQALPGKLAVFANYMNGFSNLAPATVTDANGNNPTLKIFDPEKANQWEAGVKSSLYKDKISLQASYYNIIVSNRTYTDPTNPNNILQGARVQSHGVELSVMTNPIEGLSIIGGISHNKAEYLDEIDEGGYKGQRPEESGPATLINFWANYRVQSGGLKGLGLGFGGNYGSAFNTLNRLTIGSFTLPAYTVLNAMVSYGTEKYSINLKLDNLTNLKYFSGWSTVTPQRLRSISLGVSYKFQSASRP